MALVFAIMHLQLSFCPPFFFLFFFAHFLFVFTNMTMQLVFCLFVFLRNKGSIHSKRLMDMGTAHLPFAKVKSGHISFELSIGPPAVGEAID